MTELFAFPIGPISYLFLALIAYCDTLVGVGFFVFGEVAFVSAGAMFAASGHIGPIVAVMASAWAGDLTSFWIGRHYGSKLSCRYLHSLKRRRNWRNVQSALAKQGVVYVIAARFLGPIAWITPMLAGTMGMRPNRFAAAAAVGVFLGAGQFVVLGAFGFHVSNKVYPFLIDHAWSIGLLILLTVLAVTVFFQSKGSFSLRACKSMTAAVLVFLSINLMYFFVFDTHTRPPSAQLPAHAICTKADNALLAYPGATDLHLPQPINVVLLSNGAGSDLMKALNWHQNLTFSNNSIGLLRFASLLLQSTPPVSELFWRGTAADSAFQLPGNLKSREHIRWWDLASGLSVGAISRDDELAIKYYRHLPVLLHDINPYVDKSRDMLAKQIKENTTFEILGYSRIGTPVFEAATADYETDGRILVVAEPGRKVSDAVMSCLRLARDAA
ncbi:LssY C-terminal domain-containing protein [Shimia sp. MMG029]|uniref:LssY C-terminal domain-containing protein n=1 Tax=Shimia sp. MMG029 TaxID=3021978 RepID=UPI0022FDD67F|nr:LssY C-terminal domain-containing protein [Shimia sp. MMG029]MDA5557673.1 LssY C-terminal domain-containing protein [Shimia sp. MMG029]